MLSTDEFAQWSKKVVLFLHNTSRCEDEPYPNLLFEKGGNGWPTMTYLDADGNFLLQVGHVTPVDELEAGFQKVMTWKALRAEVDAGAKTRAKELFVMELGMGMLRYAQAEKTFGSLEFTDAEKAELEQQLVNLQFTEILRETPRDTMAEGGAKFLAMFRQKRIPNTSQETSFWQYMFAHAAAKQDVDLFESLLATVKKEKAGDRRLSGYLPRLEQQLEELKKQKGN